MASAFTLDSEVSESQLLRHFRKGQHGLSSQNYRAECRHASLLLSGASSVRARRALRVGDTFCIRTMGTSDGKDLVAITGLSLTGSSKISLRVDVLVTASTPWEYHNLTGIIIEPGKDMSWSAHLRESTLKFLAWVDGSDRPLTDLDQSLTEELSYGISQKQP